MSSFREINSDIIIRYLEGKLTGEEKAFLVEWLEKDKENRDFLFGVKEMYLAGKWKDISRKADTSTEWERLRGAVSKKAMPQRSGMRHYYIRAMRYSAIAAVLALCFGLGLFYRDSFRNEQFYRVETNAGERALVSLPDGSTIRLNSMSLLSYPSDFSDENRQVSLKGEAAFDISASEEHPFRVHTGEYTVKEVAPAGEYDIDKVVAVLTDASGEDVNVTMTQKWPVKVAIKNYREKPRPNRIMETGVRIIDTFDPIAEGGTGFIPGPFGCGKTVLQHAIAKQGEADVIVMAACGERANEVVEIFTEFPELIDAHTGRHLMERTTIICNTSNMPVAAREASVYTAMTICEYYRAMGLRCLLLADSTSRWAQALREMSNRMEELPGADAFPVDLSAIIATFYSRAGMVVLNNGKTGAITFIGTVSPAGGNLKEPVTESTKKAARCFYALEQNRADQKRYPAVSPIDSYSKYLEYPEIIEYLDEKIEKGWVDKVLKAKNIVRRGKEMADQINSLGDDGVPMSYHEAFWKSELIDFAFLQQDAFDDVDALCPISRQKFMLDLILDICDRHFEFDDFEQCRNYFKQLINVLRQMNYSKFDSEQFKDYQQQLSKLLS